ncbi:MAG: caspase family protein [Deltaproteobacteria bacterium]|nr:caspase family protein [Deltaproteobacteria bacterium]
MTDKVVSTGSTADVSEVMNFGSGSKAALVIGNGGYKDNALSNPPNDATDIAAKLKKLGFRVDTLIEANQQQMEEAVVRFSRTLRHGDAGLFYYAGHGIQVGSVNYMIPIGAEIRTESEVKYKAVNVNWVLEQINEAKNGLNIVILDACRDNPLGRGLKRSSASGGLAPITIDPTGNGTFIAFATAPGQTAEDGNGRNGTYTKHLLANLDVKGKTLEQVFKLTRAGVKQETNGRQVPWDASSVVGEFFFNPGP